MPSTLQDTTLHDTTGRNTITVILAGVGGQGTILAADLLAKTAIASGADVKLSEIHGMSQRGGAVTTVVRIGEEVHSMVVDEGCADYLLAFERTEALRNIQFLREDATLLVNNASIKPLPVACGRASMPANDEKRLEQFGAILIPALQLAQEAGSARTANVVLLGALASGMPFARETWEEQIVAKVPPATTEANLKAFSLGWDSAQG